MPWTTLVQSWVLPALLSAGSVLPSVLPAFRESFSVKLLGSECDRVQLGVAGLLVPGDGMVDEKPKS